MKRLLKKVKLLIDPPEEPIQKAITYQNEWKKYSKECKRIETIFNIGDQDKIQLQSIEYLNHLEQIRFHLKQLSALDEKYEK